MGNKPPCSWWFRPSKSRKYFKKCTMGAPVLILELTRRSLKLGRDFTGSVVNRTSRTGARYLRPVRRSRNQGLGARGPLQQYNVGPLFERIAVDIAGPFPMTEDGNKYIMVVSDYFSKWPEAYAIRNQEATTVATTLIDNWISRLGLPMELHLDQGKNFESKLFQTVTEEWGYGRHGLRCCTRSQREWQNASILSWRNISRRWWPNFRKIRIDIFHCSY